jgi:hemerythrin-like domain-containing protein
MTRAIHDAVAEQGFAMHEHRELLPWIERIHDVGCAVGHLPAGELSVSLHRVIVWLKGDLEDHAAWEEAWLYPEIDERAGTHWATKVMRFEHQQIRAAVRRLAADQADLGHELTGSQASELAAQVFGLEAVLRAHLECEDRVMLPLLDDPATARDDVATG